MTLDDYPYATRAGAKLWQAEDAGERATSHQPHVSQLEIPQPLREELRRELEAEQSTLWKFTFTIAIALLVTAIGNVLMLPVADVLQPGPGFIVGLSFLFALVGSIGGQAALLAVLAVWGGGSLWIRQTWHWGLALTAFSAWLFGFLMTFGDRQLPDENFLAVLLGLPVLALAVQLAVWPTKVYMHWRIAPINEGREPNDFAPSPAEQLSIRDMIVTTLVVAASLGAVRLGKPENVENAAYWLAWGIACGSAACGSVLVVLLVYLTLGVRRIWLGTLGVTTALGSVAAIASFVLIWLGFPGPTNNQIIVMMVSTVCGFALVAPGTLWIARSLGYRLCMTRPVGGSPFQNAAGKTGSR
jgi:MFS family permease